LDGRRLAEEMAEVIEMLLVSGGFFTLVAGPFLFEFGGGHGQAGSVIAESGKGNKLFGGYGACGGAV
jgi:hypothetical protein